jgi:hypothetical protein
MAEPTGPPPPMDRAAMEQRNAEIVGARMRGIGTEQVARTYGISVRRVRQVVEEWRATNPTLRSRDPLEIVDEILEQYAGAVEELALISATTSYDAVRVGAIRARMDTLRQMTELLQATGVLPHDLGKLRVDLDVRYVAEAILTVLDEEGVPQEVQQRLVGLLERGAAPAGGNGASAN